MVEEAELWLRDPVKVVQDLLGRTSLRDATTYAPVRAYTGEDQLVRIYDKMWTGDWWYETQVRISFLSPPPLVVKPELTRFYPIGKAPTRSYNCFGHSGIRQDSTFNIWWQQNCIPCLPHPRKLCKSHLSPAISTSDSPPWLSPCSYSHLLFFRHLPAQKL